MMSQAQSMVEETGKGTTALSQEILPLIQLVSDLVARRFDRFLTTKYGLTTPQYQLLLAAVNHPEMTLGDLSDYLNCSRGNVTGIVDRLERDEWLKRERSLEDRRVIMVRLADKGLRVREIEQELNQQMKELAAIWNPVQQQSLHRDLTYIYNHLKD